MPISQHHPWDTKTFHAGVNGQLDEELLGKGEQGEYLAARNMRPNSTGKSGSLVSIGGEVEFYPGVDNSWNNYYGLKVGSFNKGDWKCMATTYVTVNGEPVPVEMWCDVNGKLDPFVRVGGLITCASGSLPIYHDKPIQVASRDSAELPEFTFSNNVDSPITLRVDDMLLNSGETVNGVTGVQSEKYFNEFDPIEHGVQVATYNHIPKFIELTTNTSYTSTTGDVSIFTPETGDEGLKVGQHSYQTRYSSDSGDKGSLSIPTPLIPVGMSNVQDVNNAYPNVRSYGGEEGTQSNQGVVLAFRVENRLNYEYVEVYRTSYDTGQPLGFTPTTILVGKIPVLPDEISIKIIVDFGGDEGALTVEDSSTTPRSIKTCKSIRYFNNRKWLFNVEYGTNIVDDDVFPDRSPVPVLKNMGRVGHADPYNCAYYKNYRGGERYGFAYVFFDSNYMRSFALPIPGYSNYQMPGRRGRMSSKSVLYSYGTVPVGADDDNDNGNVFERFSLQNAVKKGTAYNDFPMQPFGMGDENTWRLDYVINDRVQVAYHQNKDYSPKGFGHEYYSLGMAFPGVDVSKLPSWVTSFTIVRTAPAGRVKFQGAGAYMLYSPDRKEVNKVAFYSPETDSLCGVIDLDQLNWNYLKAEIVAPYGMFSEAYYGMVVGKKKYVDIISYLKVIKDTGEINIGGCHNNPNNNVLFGRWRNNTSPAWVSSGEKTFDVSNFSVYTGDNITDRGGVWGEYFEMRLDKDIYNTENCPSYQYLSNEAAQFHEPFYLFNIVNEQAVTPGGNIVNYYDTGTYVKLKSCIGRFDNTKLMYPLVDERWEDCIPSINTCVLDSRNTFIHVKDMNGDVKKWLNVTKKSALDIAFYRQQINDNGYVVVDGYNVYGLYTHTADEYNRQFSIVFSVLDSNGVIMVPNDNDELLVYYDNSLPIQVFGGDTYVGDVLFSPVDREANDGYLEVQGTLYHSAPLPYHEYHTTYVSFLGRTKTLVSNAIRQWVCMFVCESVTNPWFVYEIPTKSAEEIGDEYPSFYKCFPYTAYIMRPWWGYTPTDYYPNEDEWYNWGGFRYRPMMNVDYFHNQNYNIYNSKPLVGYKERVRYYDRLHYSLEQVPGTQLSPSLRTFLPGNYYDLPDEHGEGKFLWDSYSSRGNNIYAITDSGIAIVIVGKNVLSDAGGVELATIIGTQGQYVSGHVLVDAHVGMSGEMWRTAADREGMLFFANNESVYVLTGDSVTDIGRHSFYERIHPILSSLDDTKHLTGVFDGMNGEYWLQVETGTDEYVLAYCVENKHWNDRYDYRFDKYLSIRNTVYGMGNRGVNAGNGAITDKIGSGTLIGRVNMTSSLTNISAPVKFYPESPVPWILEKEFIRFRIASNVKPTMVEFFDYHGQDVQALLSTATSQYYLKDYGNYEQYVPRRLATVDPWKRRMQGRAMVYKVTYEGGDFIVRQVAIQFKILK